MEDEYGRVIDYLRISITDRCNLRCVYCMPEDGVVNIPHEEILSYEEIIKICHSAAALGLAHIKITGGEPLVRKDTDVLVKELKKIDGIQTVTLTTNGILLPRYIGALAEAGIDGINISLDTLVDKEYEKTTRGGQLAEVMEGIRAALAYPQIRVKINSVLGTNWKDNVIPLVLLGREYPLHIRFIERMPLTGSQEDSVTESHVIEEITNKFGVMTPYPNKLGSGPGVYYSLEGFKGKVGFISAMSHKFCNACNRVRLTADGKLRLCLQSEESIDLKTLVRLGYTEQMLVKSLLEGVKKKPKEHRFEENRIQADGMSKIGG